MEIYIYNNRNGREQVHRVNVIPRVGENIVIENEFGDYYNLKVVRVQHNYWNNKITLYVE